MPSMSCSSCGKRYSVRETQVGKKFSCKQCGATIRVPAAIAAAALAPVTGAVGRAKSPPPVPSIAVKKPPVDAGDEDLDALADLESSGQVDDFIPVAMTTPPPSAKVTVARPAAKPAVKRSLPRISFRLSRLAISLAVGGGALVLYGSREWMLASSASDTPQDITCADLGNNGPGSNGHVRISNYLCPSGYVYQKDNATGEWKTVWYPLITTDAYKLPFGMQLKSGARVVPDQYVDSAQIHVLIKTHQAKNSDDMEGELHRDTVEGLVINKIESLSQEERDLLHQKYPLLSEDNCYIVEEGRVPNAGMGTMMILGGVVLAGLGLVLIFKPR